MPIRPVEQQEAEDLLKLREMLKEHMAAFDLITENQAHNIMKINKKLCLIEKALSEMEKAVTVLLKGL